MNRDKARELIDKPLPDLIAMADKTRKECSGDKVELCNIMNAKSGLCAEDCKFCAQSCRHDTGIDIYPLKGVNEILTAAIKAKEIGAERFGIVTSGSTLSSDELGNIAAAISLIRDRIDIKICASLGKLSQGELLFLKDAGLGRYHHNIETSPGYFPKITTTHTFKDRLDTIRSAKAAGIEVCSGGIIGLGESWNDRIEMAFALRDLDITSVPINIFVPIKGTSLDAVPPLEVVDVIKTIALFRIILGDKTIKVAAGRESMLKDFQTMAFMAGANGMLIGGYLTIRGCSVDEDRLFVEEVEGAWKV